MIFERVSHTFPVCNAFQTRKKFNEKVQTRLIQLKTLSFCLIQGYVLHPALELRFLHPRVLQSRPGGSISAVCVRLWIRTGCKEYITCTYTWYYVLHNLGVRAISRLHSTIWPSSHIHVHTQTHTAHRTRNSLQNIWLLLYCVHVVSLVHVGWMVGWRGSLTLSRVLLI